MHLRYPNKRWDCRKKLAKEANDLNFLLSFALYNLSIKAFKRKQHMRETGFIYFNGAFNNTFGTESFREKLQEKVQKEPSLTDSKSALDTFLAKQPPNDARVIVEYEEDSRKHRKIKAIYVRSFKIPWEETHWTVHEAKYLKALPCDLQDLEKLHLTESPFQFLKKFNEDLYFMLFIDHRLFDFCLETWSHFNDREPGCVANYFQTLAGKVCKYLATPTEQRGPLTLAFVLDLHHDLTENLSMFNSGKMRNSYNAFPLTVTSASEEGIKELLLRIKTDKNKDGFRIGKLPKFSGRVSISATFAFEMWFVMMKKEAEVGWQVISKLVFSEEGFNQFKQATLIETCKKIQQDHSDISDKDIENIIENFLEEYKVIEKSRDWVLLREFFYDHSMMKIDALPVDYAYKIQYAREHAYVHAGGNDPKTDISQYSDTEIANLAQTIWNEINEGEEVCILPPSPELSKQLVETAITNFNNAIQKATNAEEVIVAVDALTHELEILHIFIDGNCRTNYILQNLLLMANQVKWSILYDPNRMDAYSKDERIKKIKEGIFCYQYILDNKDEYLEKNRMIQKSYENARSGMVWRAPEQQENSGNNPTDGKQEFKKTLEKYYAKERETIYQQAREKVSQEVISTMESTSSPKLSP